MELATAQTEQDEPIHRVGLMQYVELPLSKLKMNKNSRINVQSSDVSDLMSSIKENGLLQPIGVVKKGSEYEVCYGNRRAMAAKKLGWTKIPAIIQDSGKAFDADIKNLTENIQRRNISLAEAGRYMEMLIKEGLKHTEISARLGVAKSYVQSCLAAYRDVPIQFREDLEVKVANKKTTPGKIPMHVASAIVNARKGVGLTVAQTNQLFEAAKKSDNFIPENVRKYAIALKTGKKNFLKEVQPLKQVVTRFLVTENEYERLYQKHVVDGPFNSMGGLLNAILAGKVNERVKISEGK